MRKSSIKSTCLFASALSLLAVNITKAADFDEAFYGSLTGRPSPLLRASTYGSSAAAARPIEAKGSEKAESSIEILEKIIKLQRFDQYLLEGEDRPAGTRPDYSRLDHSMASVISFYDSKAENRHIAYLRNILLPFQQSISTISSLTHDYPEMEVIGRLGDRGFWESDALSTQFKVVFKDTDELNCLSETMKALKEVALAIESQKERAEINELKAGVKVTFAAIPTIIDLAYRTFHAEINSYLRELVSQLPVDSAHPFRRLAIIEGLIKLGETVKLLPRSLRDHPLIQKCIDFRDKAVKIIPRRITDFESDAMGEILTGGLPFISEISEWIQRDGTGAVPNDHILDRIRDMLGYKPNWKRKSDNASIPELDNTFLISFLDRVEESVDRRDTLKYPTWDSVLFKLDARLEDVVRPIFKALLEQMQERGISYSVSDLWREHLKRIVIVRTDTIEDVIAKIKAYVQGFPDILLRSLSEIGFEPSGINFSPLCDFDVTELERINAEIKFFYSRATTPTDVFSGMSGSYSILRGELLKISEDNLRALRLVTYAVCQGILDFSGTFMQFEPYKSLITKLRKYLAHARHDVEFPAILSATYGSNTANEIAAITGLYFLVLRLSV